MGSSCGPGTGGQALLLGGKARPVKAEVELCGGDRGSGRMDSDRADAWMCAGGGKEEPYKGPDFLHE